MTASPWDDPDLRVGGEFVKFENVGDTVTGTITSIRKHIFDDGNIVPKILLDCDGEERTLTAGQIRLKAALAEKRPEIGDVLTVTFASVEKRAGGKTLKHFDVTVGAGTASVTTPAIPAQAAPLDFAAAAAPELDESQKAALAAMTPEQLAALSSLGVKS